MNGAAASRIPESKDAVLNPLIGRAIAADTACLPGPQTATTPKTRFAAKNKGKACSRSQALIR